jgi:hypothetical protein
MTNDWQRKFRCFAPFRSQALVLVLVLLLAACDEKGQGQATGKAFSMTGKISSAVLDEISGIQAGPGPDCMCIMMNQD